VTLRAFAVAGALVLALGGAATSSPHAAGETRALWVVRTTLVSPSAIRDMVAAAKAGGFNTLFVQVRARGDAYFTSRLEPRPRALDTQPASFDPLALVLREAHGSGLAVHAWLCVNLVADVSDVPTSKAHIVRRHPEWLMVPRELVPKRGTLNPRAPGFVSTLVAWTKSQGGRVEGLFASPLTDGAAAHLVSVVDDLVARYPVDGLHLDYARYPGAEFDFSAGALAAFTGEIARTLRPDARAQLERVSRAKPLAIVDLYPNSWQDFRRDRLTALVRRLRATAVARRPGTVVSAAVAPDIDTARESRGQDWPLWIGSGIVDAICPMAYSTDPDTYVKQIAAARIASEGRLLFAGIGAYRLPVSQTVRHITLARQAGADGIALFSYDSLASLESGGGAIRAIGRAAFEAGSQGGRPR
jgi:uncharacterized lipoprotein YddW (UPF0748 family)